MRRSGVPLKNLDLSTQPSDFKALVILLFMGIINSELMHETVDYMADIILVVSFLYEIIILIVFFKNIENKLLKHIFIIYLKKPVLTADMSLYI